MADITALCRRVLVIRAGQLIYDGSLDGLLEQFAPAREIIVELAQPRSIAELQSYGDLGSIKIESVNPESAHEKTESRLVRFVVPQEKLTQTLTRILDNLEIVDLKVTEPPIEEVIGKVFRESQVV